MTQQNDLGAIQVSGQTEMALADDLAETAGRCSIERDRETIIKATTALRSHYLRGEPVAWQFQALSGAWNDCGDPDPRHVAKNPHRYRALYTSPQPAARIGREAVIERLQNCVDHLDEADPLPKPYDFYYAVKNEGQGTGWRYECVGLGITDIKEVLAALTASAPAGVWQDIATAPDRTEVLFWYSGSEYERAGYKIGRMKSYGGRRVPVCNSTIYSTNYEAFKGWQPLPQGPTDTARDAESDVMVTRAHGKTGDARS